MAAKDCGQWTQQVSEIAAASNRVLNTPLDGEFFPSRRGLFGNGDHQPPESHAAKTYEPCTDVAVARRLFGEAIQCRPRVG